MTSNEFTVDPYKYQLRGIKYLLKHFYCILADEQGLGKTLQAIAIILMGIRQKKKTLVVCPAYLRDNWWVELEMLPKSQWVEQEIVRNDKDLEKLDLEHTDVVMISYNFISSAEKLFDWADFVIADEAQALKELDTGWTTAFHQFVYEYCPERLLLLSGTPIKNRVQEWYSLLLLMSYDRKNSNGEKVSDLFRHGNQFAKFFSEVEYVPIRGGRVIEKFHGIRNSGRLKQLLKGKYIRRLAESELDLPKLLRKDVVVSYRDDGGLLRAWNSFVSGTPETNSSSKSKSAAIKAPFTAKYCKALYEETRQPILIFTDHRDSAKILSETLKCPEINGSTPHEKRTQIAKAFQRGFHPFLVATIRSFNTGVTLTAAKDLIFNDLNWVPGENDQALKRFYRIGQTKTCRAHYIYGSPQDRYIAHQLDEKLIAIRRAM